MWLSRYDNQNIRQIENFDFVLNNLTIESIIHGHCLLKEDWVHKDISSPFHRLYFILDGKGKIWNDTKTVPLLPGHVYFIPAHSQWSYVSDPWLEQFFIHCKVGFMKGVDIFDSQRDCLVIEQSKEYMRNIIATAQSETFQGLVAFKSSLFSIVSQLLERYDINLRPYIDRVVKYQPIFQYINENCSAELSVADILKNVSLSQSTLYRSLKEDTGYSIKQYMDKILVAQAQEYLLYSDFNVKEIAFSLKFKDQYYFSRFFKKHTGKSPSQFRSFNGYAI